MSAEAKLASLKLELPEVPQPVGSYTSLLVTGGFVFLSGLLPRRGAEVVYRGKAGADLSLEDASSAARLCALNALAVIRHGFGTLDRVERIVRLTGYVQSHPQFFDHPRVLNGASDLLREVFGEAGIHVRSAVGVASLPANAACEIELTLKVR
ncbi:MAG: RidA family protein [Candidatus Omnitrophica bacterium]|nr:RidA family protein [Candidatus Omnitrophota bacterium]